MATTAETTKAAPAKMTVAKFLDGQPRTTVYCGCIGYASGHPRGTRGRKGAHGGWTYYRCDSCGRTWKKRAATA
jgi:hypothetical protein